MIRNTLRNWRAEYRTHPRLVLLGVLIILASTGAAGAKAAGLILVNQPIPAGVTGTVLPGTVLPGGGKGHGAKPAKTVFATVTAPATVPPPLPRVTVTAPARRTPPSTVNSPASATPAPSSTVSIPPPVTTAPSSTATVTPTDTATPTVTDTATPPATPGISPSAP